MNNLERPQYSFESIRHLDDNGQEYWSARELMRALGYAKWDNFIKVIQKACRSMAATRNQPYYNINDWLPEVKKPIASGKGKKEYITDYRLTRYDCYLIAQNGRPDKPEIAQAQTYFAIQTRRQELQDIEERKMARIEARYKYSESDKKLSTIINDHEVTRSELARIKSNGDKVLFGGNNTQQMKEKLGINNSKPLADVLPTISLTAKQLANEMTYINTERNNLNGFSPINSEHCANNQTIRSSLTQRGIKLEDLPPEPDIKLLQKELKNNGRIADRQNQKNLPKG